MKQKLFSLFVVLMAALAVNATDYYYAGAANGWSNNNEAWKFTEVEGVLTLEVADLYGDFKITENGAWHPQHGAAAAGEGVVLNGSYNLVKCDDSQGEADAPADCKILIPAGQGEGEWRYKNAKLTLDAADPDHLVIALVAGTLYDHSDDPKTYQIVGSFNGWSAADAPSFEEVNGVLTVTVDNLSGTFKIIEEHSWTNQWGRNWDTGEDVVLGEPYLLGAKTNSEPANLALANPFAGYTNAVLTLTKNSNDAFVLTLVSGTFYVTENDWFIVGAWNGWACNAAAKMTPVAENTYELDFAEFSGEIKAVYGNWAAEFGSAKQSQDTWELYTPYPLSYPCDNIRPASYDVYENVTIRITVDYVHGTVTLLVYDEHAPVPATYYVTYCDKNDGTIDSEPVNLTLPEAPIVPGFTFTGWEVVGGSLEDGIKIRATYTYNGDQTSAPAVVANPANPAQKLIRNGKVYILHDGNTYTVQGQEVR